MQTQTTLGEFASLTNQHFIPLDLYIDAIFEFGDRKSHERYGSGSERLPKSMCGVGYLLTPSLVTFFFEDQTVNQKNFLEMLEGQIIPEVLRKREDAIFQLDGAPPHWGLQVRGMLNDVFPDGWIRRGGPTSIAQCYTT